MAMESTSTGRFTRRTFLGWWMSSLLTATLVAGGLPILVFLWPAPPKGQMKGKVKIQLTKSINQLANGDAVKFDAPKNPNAACTMADGAGDNAAADPACGAC